jgi:hypothetical protein
MGDVPYYFKGQWKRTRVVNTWIDDFDDSDGQIAEDISKKNGQNHLRDAPLVGLERSALPRRFGFLPDPSPLLGPLVIPLILGALPTLMLHLAAALRATSRALGTGEDARVGIPDIVSALRGRRALLTLLAR